MIRYTEDKWGALVFPVDTDLTKLNFDNCFVAIGTQSIWVFPFTRLNKYIQDYENFSKFLGDKHNYYYLDGKVSNRTYHYACKNKLNYLTGQCEENTRYYHATCSGFEVEEKFSFRWHKAICEYVVPVYADKTGTARRIMYFTELCPTAEIETINKATLSERGKRAGLSRSMKKKCVGCIYGKVCTNRWQKAEENCHVSRKALNRTIRQLAVKRFGSFQKLVELCRHSESDYHTLFPISKKHFVVQEINGHYVQFERKTTSDIRKSTHRAIVTPQLENKAKVLMLFLHLCSEKSNNNCSVLNPKAVGYQKYRLMEFREGRRWTTINRYDFQSYDDVFKKLGVPDKRVLFK